MRFLELCKDGGSSSTVWAYVLIELKWFFSVMLLHFEDGSREAYHDHAFNAISWVLSGRLTEYIKDGPTNEYRPSWRPIITKRTTFHKVVSDGDTWVFTLRGPWKAFWREYMPDEDREVTLTHGRMSVTSNR